MPELRRDIVCVLVARERAGIEFLQLLRAREPAKGTWQPVMGSILAGETSIVAGARELEEETGLTCGDPALVGAWAIETVEPFYWHTLDAIVLCPRFVVEVDPAWRPSLNDEHEDARWVGSHEVRERFAWTSVAMACEEALRVIRPGSDERRAAADLLRVELRR